MPDLLKILDWLCGVPAGERSSMVGRSKRVADDSGLDDDDGFDSRSEVNPSTGSPMIDGIGGVDAGGNFFGETDDLWSD